MPQQYRSPILFYLARQYRLAYLQVPKVACTSFKTAIGLLNRPELAASLAENPDEIHNRRELSDIAGSDAPELQSFLRFTFVRDPYARFVSFYFSKIARRDGAGPVPRFLKLGYTAGMSIDDVLDRVEATPLSDLDPHLLPQWAFLMRDDRLQVDFIGRLERIAQDLPLVEAWAGVKLNVGELNVTKKVEAAAARQALNSSQQKRVQRIYARDFELLRYEA